MSLIAPPESFSNKVVPFAQPKLRGERRDPALEPHAPITYASLRRTFDEYHDLIEPTQWLAIGSLFGRLKRGEPLSIDDARLVRDLRARIRLVAES